MYDFILQIIVFSSLGLIIYLLARVIPRFHIDKNITQQLGPPNTFIDKLLGKLPLNKIDLTINNLLSRILRQVKVLILKFDNLINNYLNKLKKTNGNGKINENDVMK